MYVSIRKRKLLSDSTLVFILAQHTVDSLQACVHFKWVTSLFVFTQTMWVPPKWRFASVWNPVIRGWTMKKRIRGKLLYIFWSYSFSVFNFKMKSRTVKWGLRFQSFNIYRKNILEWKQELPQTNKRLVSTEWYGTGSALYFVTRRTSTSWTLPGQVYRPNIVELLLESEKPTGTPPTEARLLLSFFSESLRIFITMTSRSNMVGPHISNSKMWSKHAWPTRVYFDHCKPLLLSIRFPFSFLFL